MALQGTIETFALPDVMRLLASTNKTGCLRLEGTRGSGSIWVDSGQVVASEATGAPHATEAVDVVFELLRFPDGDFVFEADQVHASPGSPTAVEPTLTAAEEMVQEWHAIEAVVPSLESWVTLASELPGDEITVDKARWKLLVAVGSGVRVGQLGDQLELAELPVSRSVKELVEQGLVTVGEAPAGADLAAPTITASAPAPAPAPERVLEPIGEPELDEPADDERFERFDPGALVIEPDPVSDVEAPEPPAPPAAPAPSGDTLNEPGDAAEIARQLANLSPKAAKAVAAAAKATTPEEREAALAEVDDDEDPINRDLLIKFLGSVNG